MSASLKAFSADFAELIRAGRVRGAQIRRRGHNYVIVAIPRYTLLSHIDVSPVVTLVNSRRKPQRFDTPEQAAVFCVKKLRLRRREIEISGAPM